MSFRLTGIIILYSSQYTREGGGIVSTHHQIWSTTRFLGRWLRILGSFLWKIGVSTLKLAKTTPKKGYFCYFRAFSVQIWSIWVFRVADHEYRDPVNKKISSSPLNLQKLKIHKKYPFAKRLGPEFKYRLLKKPV